MTLSIAHGRPNLQYYTVPSTIQYTPVHVIVHACITHVFYVVLQ